MLLLTILLCIVLLEVSYLIYRPFQGQLSKSGESKPVLVDTSALMDARLVVAAQTGFIPNHLLIPTSVVSELQLLADQADAEKRSRARRGLDAIKELQSIDDLNVTILEDGPVGEGGVDARLVELAVKHGGSLCTIDFNLNKVATVKGVRVLNINELAGSIRMAFLPGETVSLQLNQKGQGSGQAVGYLADGTMVVVDKAAGAIGEIVEVEFVRSLQTAAGRMMFARLPAKAQTTKKGTDAKIEKQSKPDTPIDTPESVSENRGRRPVQKQLKREQSAEKSSDGDSSNKRQQRRQPNRRQTKEDDLIRLLNDQ